MPWTDGGIDPPEGEEVPDGLRPLRLLVNYWDQTLLALFGLYRGLGKDPGTDRLFDVWPDSLRRFVLAAETGRGERSHAIVDGRYRLIRLVGLAGLDGSALGLQGVDLTRCRLVGARFAGANLSGAALTRADLLFAILRDANLGGADLVGADLTDAKLTDAKLTGAKLTGANLAGASVAGTNLADADLRDAQVTDGQLRQTRGRPRYLPNGSAPGDDYRNLDTPRKRHGKA